MKFHRLFGFSICNISRSESFKKIWICSSKKLTTVYFANIHSLTVALQNSSLHNAVKNCSFLLNDGVGVEFASYLKGNSFSDNLNGTDWIPSFFTFIGTKDRSVSCYLLGSRSTVIDRCLKTFPARWPHMYFVGGHHGYIDLMDEEPLLEIEKCKPKILLVGMGVPKQEIWIEKHAERLKEAGVSIAIGGGAILDFLSENIPRAPYGMRVLRLEWLYRLYLEPRRLFYRYLIEPFIFFYYFLFQKHSSEKENNNP